MAVAENGVASGAQHFETTDLERSNGNHVNNNEKSEKTKDQGFSLKNNQNHNHNHNNNIINGTDSHKPQLNGADDEKNDGFEENHGLTKSGTKNGTVDDDNNIKEKNNNLANGEGLKKEISDLEEMLSKLNPMAKEFVPPSLVSYGSFGLGGKNNFGYVNNFLIQQPNAGGNVNEFPGRRRRNSFGQGKRRMNSRTSMAQREEVIRRTVYVSDIDQQVTEEQLAALFINCGQVVDCRVCGDPNSILRFAFIEFTDEEGAKNALSLSGTMLGYYPVRVLPSKTAIAPVNPTFLPKSEDEREMCARTVYVTNIDKKVTQADVKLFFESFCGEVQRLRLLGDYRHSTRIAFVEFVMAESAISALNCSGAVLGTLPIRVSPSKTPVRPRPPRSPVH
uniref:RRM domain-containing protein n=1 Tax=Opuntia streptacantha TaxID=393608 RepID=A0A7C9A1F4_OPUST